MPSIPSHQWVRCQFAPNDDFVAKASQFTGKLDIKRAIQTRTLKKAHEDQHWVNAYARYHYEHLIKCRTAYLLVEFFGQDDKAKIGIGEPEAPISTGVRSNVTAIVPVGGEDVLKAADHDWKVGSLTPSVTLRANIPKDRYGWVLLCWR